MLAVAQASKHLADYPDLRMVDQIMRPHPVAMPKDEFQAYKKGLIEFGAVALAERYASPWLAQCPSMPAMKSFKGHTWRVDQHPKRRAQAGCHHCLPACLLPQSLQNLMRCLLSAWLRQIAAQRGP